MARLFTHILAAAGLAAALTGCNYSMHPGGNGIPLAELERAGTAPDEVTLAGPDRVIVTRGDAFAVTVEGDSAAVDLIRFDRSDGSLGIYREDRSDNVEGKATVRVTLPVLHGIAIAGSGIIEADELTGNAEVGIAGSGQARAARIAAQTLQVNFGGSGRFTGAGTAERLELNIAGSGKGDMAGLRVGSADVTIAGSGQADFASDGKVQADIIGSGTVRVAGNAQCSVEKVGSGRLICGGGTGMVQGTASE